MRRREIEKELGRLKSLYKKDKATYETVHKKDSVLGRYYYNRMIKTEERMEYLNKLLRSKGEAL